VSELTQKNLPSYFAKQSEQADFKYAKHNLEIYGVCKDCTK
jgi:Fe2+ or Zn2+ uptake regulation protein